MKFSVKGFAIASGLMLGGSLFLVGLIDLVVPGYGPAFLELMASIYPGFDNSHSVTSVLIGTGYGLIDGAIGGALFAWLYNQFS